MSISRRGIRGAVVVQAVSSALFCIAPAALAAEPDPLGKALQIIKRHRLLSRAELACSFVMDAGSTASVARVDVREKHESKCGGDPNTAPRRFSLEIDLRSGAVQWDNTPDLEMRPIPARR
jgi:hypothetical protein